MKKKIPSGNYETKRGHLNVWQSQEKRKRYSISEWPHNLSIIITLRILFDMSKYVIQDCVAAILRERFWIFSFKLNNHID